MHIIWVRSKKNIWIVSEYRPLQQSTDVKRSGWIDRDCKAQQIKKFFSQMSEIWRIGVQINCLKRKGIRCWQGEPQSQSYFHCDAIQSIKSQQDSTIIEQSVYKQPWHSAELTWWYLPRIRNVVSYNPALSADAALITNIQWNYGPVSSIEK